MTFEDAIRNAAQGNFATALEILDTTPIVREKRIAATALRCDLLQRTGKYREAKNRSHALLGTDRLATDLAATCHLVLGRTAWEEGHAEKAGNHLQRAIAMAQSIKDYETVSWAQMRLLISLFDASGPEAVAPLLADLRANAARAGNAHVLAGVHLHIAQMESKRSLLASAERHINLAAKILDDHPNAWLLAMAEEHRAALACLKLDFDCGIAHARRAGDLAAAAGWASGRRTSIAILGHLLYHAGRFEEAAECCLQALSTFIFGSDNFSGTLETLARIRLSQGRLDEAEDALKEIERCLASPESRSRFVYRYALLTKARLLHFRGDCNQALSLLEDAIRLGQKTSDETLITTARLSKVQILAETQRPAELVSIFDELTRTISITPLDKQAAYEHILACGLMSAGDAVSARQHIARAKVIYEAVEHRLGLLELATCRVISPGSFSETSAAAVANNMPSPDRIQQQMLQAVAAILNHLGRPALIAREMLDLVAITKCAVSAEAITRNQNGDRHVIASIADENDAALDLPERTLTIGEQDQCCVELVLHPKADINSCATINAISRLIATIADLHRAQIDREDRAMIWPTDDSQSDGSSVIGGHMQEVMALAQKVARTTVNVLITGDSGTGKEIVARAIHNYSARAHKPFVPFNCAAVPRDLVESQLFGHRRGAFTGAERDYLGLIRTAKDGTLFLDEIGELSLDLQPKLLRFLESGEISPLGENAPIHVNVRIVAATNTNLEAAVRAGKFREDLFYRLNVVRLSLKPLRERRDELPALVNHFVTRAAQEFGKGRLEVAEETMERLLLYRWPGNVRQLQNELRRMVALAEPNSTLQPTAISDEILRAMPIFRTEALTGKEIAVRLHDKLLPTLSRVECEMIKTALRENHGKVDAVAKALGISRKGLYLKRQRLGL